MECVASSCLRRRPSNRQRLSQSHRDVALPLAPFHLASVGWLRKHLGWKKDAKGDEEPG